MALALCKYVNRTKTQCSHIFCVGPFWMHYNNQKIVQTLTHTDTTWFIRYMAHCMLVRIFTFTSCFISSVAGYSHTVEFTYLKMGSKLKSPVYDES